MSRYPHRVLRKRDGYLPLSGSIIESDPTPTGSLLVQNTVPVPNPGSTPTGIPLLGSPVPQPSSTVVQSSSPTATAGSSASSSNPISLGTVIGACIGALIVLLLAVLLAFYCSRRQKRSTAYAKSRNVGNNVFRRRSHLEPWKRINEDADRLRVQEQPMTQRPQSGALSAMFHRTMSNTSGEKSSHTYNRESVGTMEHFAKYHSGLAAQMASQGTANGVDGKVAKPSPAVLHLAGHGSEPICWDGETVGGESLASPQGSASPVMMTTAKSTPPAMVSSLHHWESAEVVHVGSDVSEDGNPFADKASSIKGSIKTQNPFFSGRDQRVRRTTLLADTHKNPFADPPRDPSAAIQSLIAALQDTRSSDDRIVSIQSSHYSGTTVDDGESAVSVTAFPYPPTQINVG